MLNGIWAVMILVSLLCALATGRMEELSAAVFSGSQKAVELVLGMAGMMAAWTGMLKIAEAGGMTGLLEKAMRPLTRRLFPEYGAESGAAKAICMNVTANLLGLGNAATPMGIAAMKSMAEESRGQATNSMVRFVVLNTASLQLIPTMLGALRASYGSGAPFAILPAVWVTSAASLLTALAAVFLMEKRHG